MLAEGPSFARGKKIKKKNLKKTLIKIDKKNSIFLAYKPFGHP